MERRLYEAALTGDVQKLHQLLGENPLTLHTVSLASSGNPLHVVKEIRRLRPDFAEELNEDGFSPMHMASANGYLEILRELLKVDRKLCRLQGRENKTPLHLAVIKGRVDVISEILSACGECLEDVTVQRDTAMHLAIKNYQFEVIRVMVDWIREMKKEYVLNMKDDHGNTALHLATAPGNRNITWPWRNWFRVDGSKCQYATNQTGLTALYLLLIFPSEAGDREIEEILLNAGAMRRRDVTLSPSPTPEEPYCQTFVNSPTYIAFKQFGRLLQVQERERFSRRNTECITGYRSFGGNRNLPSRGKSLRQCMVRQLYTITRQRTQCREFYLGGIAFGLCMFFNSVGFYIVSNFHCSLSFKYAWLQCSPHMA